VSMKQTSVAAADCSSTSGQTRRSYVGRSWQSWCVGSERSSLRVADRSWRLRVSADSWTHIDAGYGGAIWC